MNALDKYPGEDEIGVLKTSSVSNDSFNPHESKTVVEDERNLVQCPIEDGAIIISRMNTPERVGACGLVLRAQPNLYLPDRLWKLKLKSGTDSRFLHILLTSNIYKSRIVKMATGTSGSMHNIPKDSFLDMRVVLPDIAEQSHIGEFFRTLDDLIAAAKKKAELLKLKKRYYLQAIFSQRLRFRGFTEPWQQRKAKECFIPVSEKDHPELPVLSSTQELGMLYRHDLDINIKYDQSALSSYKTVHPGDFVISLRSFQGGFEHSDKLGIVSPAYTIFQYANASDNDDYFWKTYFKSYVFIESLKKVALPVFVCVVGFMVG